MKRLVLFLALTMGLWQCLAQTSLPSSGKIPFTPFERVAVELHVPCESSVACSEALEFPAVPPKEGMTVVLKLNQRIIGKLNSGWNQYCGIELNGKDVTDCTDANMPRLLMRGPVMHTRHPREAEVPYWRTMGHPYLLCLFAPEDESRLDSRVIDRQFGYDFYLVIDDIVSKRLLGADDRVENDKPNHLRFYNGLLKNVLDTSLYIKEATVGYVPTARINALSGMNLRHFAPMTNPKAVVKGDGFYLNIGASGGMELVNGAGRLYFESMFSYPRVPAMGFNVFGPDGAVGEAGISVTVDADGVVHFKTKKLEITRRIESHGHYLRVLDEIRNVSSQDVGLVWKHQVAFSGSMPAVWRIAGLTGCQVSDEYCGMNPTLYLSDNKTCGVGIIAEDTVSRNLLEMRVAGNALSLGSKGIGIGAGKSRVVDWTIYPLSRDAMGYFDFINRVREDWGVNNTIPGPFHFAYKDAYRGLNLQFAFINKWHLYSDGWKLSDDQYVAEVTRIANGLREKFPGIQLLGKVETNLIPFKVSQFEWSKELPLTRGDRKNPRTKYAQYLSPELSEKLAAVSPYRDSMLWNDKGGVMIDNWYTYDNYDTINLMVQVEKGNARFRKFMEQIDIIMDRAGLNGLYIDQFNPGPKDGIDYSKWDGVSVRLDKAGNIVSRFYNYTLTGAEGRREIVRRIVEKGGIAFTNGHPVTREEQNSGRLSFVEMENNNVNPIAYLDKKPPETSWTVLGHLASPITLNLRPQKFTRAPTTKGALDLRAQFLTKGFILALRNATLPYYYTSNIPTEGPTAGSFEITNCFFPFTPVRIGEGVMVGEERTLVCVSGTYTVKGKQKPVLAKFNRYGKPVDASFEITGGPGNWRVKVALHDWNEIAAIIVQE